MSVQLKGLLKKSVIIILLIALLFLGVSLYGDFYNRSTILVTSVGDTIEDFYDFENAIINLNKNDISYQIESNKTSNQNYSYSVTNNETDDDNSIKKVQEQSEFMLKRLIVHGNLKINYGAISVYSYNNLHILCYSSEKETEYAYNELKKDNSLKVIIDKYNEVEGYADNSYDYSTGYTNWGAQAIDIGGYREYLTDNNVQKEVVVVVMDTGLNTSHEMFKNRLLTDSNGKIKGFSYYNSTYQYSYNNLAFDSSDTNKYSFEDDGGHGTHVAGIICDLTPSNVKILPIKIGNPENKNSSTSSTMISAYLRVINIYSKQYNVVCTNLSYSGGGKGSEDDRDTFNEQCYEPLKELGILPITAAGNESQENNIEGLEAVVVSSLKNKNNNYQFDNSYSNYGKIIDISAPGTYIKSAYINKTNAANSKIYAIADGTSMASPQVAGAVALLYLNPEYEQYSANDMEQKLYNLSLDLGIPSKDIYYGHGMVNLRYFEVQKTQTLSFYRNQMLIEDYCDYVMFKDSFDLKIACSDSTFDIIYTTDKTIPNVNSCTYYQLPINVESTIFVYAMGVKIQNGEIVQKTELYNISFFDEDTPIEDCFEIDKDGTITEYTGKFTTVNVPSYIKGIEVTGVGVSVFRMLNIESITFPESCETFAGYVFESCKNLKYVYAPGVTKIYKAAFYASSITFVTDEHPQDSATEGCYLPALTEVVSWTFALCENLKSVKLSKMDFSAEYGSYDFIYCTSLEQVDLPSITVIPEATFYSCSSLKTFTISKNVTAIGDMAFCANNLENIYVEAGNVAFYSDKDIAVYNSSSLIIFANGYRGDYDICDKVTINGKTTAITSLGYQAMYGCNIDNLSIPETITSIDIYFAADATIKNLYYNAINVTETLYYEHPYIGAPFDGSIIENMIIGENVDTLPERIFQESVPKNVIIKSYSTKYSSCCFYIFSRNGEACPFNIYLDFDDTITASWLSMLSTSQASYMIETLYTKNKLPSTYTSYTSLKYKGMDIVSNYYAYSKNGSMVTASVVGNGTITPSGDIAVLDNTARTFTMVPKSGYMLIDVKVNGTSVGPVDNYTFNSFESNQTIVAHFVQIGSYFAISIVANEGGTISPNNKVFVEKNKSQTFTITPNTGYQVADVKIDGVSRGALQTYTFTNVTSEHAIEVVFEKITYQITATAGGNGQISPSGKVGVKHGENQIFTFTPDDEYYVKKIVVDGTALGQLEQELAITNGYTFRNVTSTHTISVEFAIKKYAVNYILANYNMENMLQEYPKGAQIVLPETPFYSYQYYFEGWYTDDSYNELYQFSTMQTESITVYGKFNTKTYNVSITTVSKGFASPVQLDVTVFDDAIINITPNTGYQVGDIKVDNVSISSKLIEVINTTGKFDFSVEDYGFKIKDNSKTEQHNVIIEFSPILFDLTFNLNYDDETIVEIFGTDSDIILPNTPQRTGYTFDGWYNDIDCVNLFDLTTMPASDLQVYAKWKINSYNISATNSENGSISPSGTIQKNYNQSQVFTISANTGYHIGKIIVDDVELTNSEINNVIDNGYIFNNISDNHTIYVQFDINTYHIEFDVQGNGKFYCEENIIDVEHGDSRTFLVEMNSDLYNIEITIDGDTVYLKDGKLVVENINDNMNIVVKFTEKGFFETTIGLAVVIVSVVSITALLIVVKVIKVKTKRKMELGNFDFKNFKF